ncbi:hypothetical protein BpHYR1_038096 [Brachionus plicatilis]|uniref:Uncharacterized protein n=1 Tax=Brachionus plicatilis TaxID=10195 RepID=A0A3M7Q3V1_BRAPC|nr:hypothetical protein BpHYR1_038096 [Brachionus plicatilis]
MTILNYNSERNLKNLLLLFYLKKLSQANLIKYLNKFRLKQIKRKNATFPELNFNIPMSSIYFY